MHEVDCNFSHRINLLSDPLKFVCRLTKSACGNMDECDGQECIQMKQMALLEIVAEKVGVKVEH